ncbi:uncharacterized protein LOC125178054 [Hyalella azteca]|uniref:Uncharacterized protein LOC125178054 n=1 Tax=Hyalella azteca TaxID=294128 RepID=A0A979FL03_HYAAZ|nr:uncharacterized protein LOC125178054 [Hyalella azteca]
MTEKPSNLTVMMNVTDSKSVPIERNASGNDERSLSILSRKINPYADIMRDIQEFYSKVPSDININVTDESSNFTMSSKNEFMKNEYQTPMKNASVPDTLETATMSYEIGSIDKKEFAEATESSKTSSDARPKLLPIILERKTEKIELNEPLESDNPVYNTANFHLNEIGIKLTNKHLEFNINETSTVTEWPVKLHEEEFEGSTLLNNQKYNAANQTSTTDGSNDTSFQNVHKLLSSNNLSSLVPKLISKHEMNDVADENHNLTLWKSGGAAAEKSLVGDHEAFASEQLVQESPGNGIHNNNNGNTSGIDVSFTSGIKLSSTDHVIPETNTLPTRPQDQLLLSSTGTPAIITENKLRTFSIEEIEKMMHEMQKNVNFEPVNVPKKDLNIRNNVEVENETKVSIVRPKSSASSRSAFPPLTLAGHNESVTEIHAAGDSEGLSNTQRMSEIVVHIQDEILSLFNQTDHISKNIEFIEHKLSALLSRAKEIVRTTSL